MVDPCRRPVPALPGLGADAALPFRVQLAALDEVEGHVSSHHLGHRRRRHAPIGILGEEHCARRQVDHVGDLGSGLEGRRRGGDRKA
jgi:hypothetical protein